MGIKDLGKRLYENVMGTDEQNRAAEEAQRQRQAAKDRAQTKKMRAPTQNEANAMDTIKSQNRLAKEYEDMGKPKNLVENIRKEVMPEKLRKEADRTFKNLPEEVKDYEAYKDAGFKRGGSVRSSASKRADGCAQRGKTKGRMV